MTSVNLNLKKPYISQAICIISYELDKDIRYAQKAAEDHFGPMFSTQSQQTNVPDDFDPNAPRLIFQAGQAGSKQLMLSQAAAQYMLGFESSSEKSLDEQLGIISRNVKDFGSRTARFKSPKEIKEYALILNINYPSKELTRDMMSSYLHQRFFSFSPLGNVAATSLKVGYLVPEQLYLNITSDIYELRKGQFKAEAGSQHVDLTTLPLAEQGFLVQIDLNTKPKTNCDIGDLDVIIDVSANFIEKTLPDFMGF